MSENQHRNAPAASQPSLTASLAALMLQIPQKRGISVQELADRLGVSDGTIRSQALELEQRGLLERTKRQTGLAGRPPRDISLNAAGRVIATQLRRNRRKQGKRARTPSVGPQAVGILAAVDLTNLPTANASPVELWDELLARVRDGSQVAIEVIRLSP